MYLHYFKSPRILISVQFLEPRKKNRGGLAEHAERPRVSRVKRQFDSAISDAVGSVPVLLLASRGSLPRVRYGGTVARARRRAGTFSHSDCRSVRDRLGDTRPVYVSRRRALMVGRAN